MPSQKPFITFIFSNFDDLIAIPKITLNKIINNIFPLAMEKNIFPENIFRKNVPIE